MCAITHVLPYKYAYWIPVIAFEFLLFVLAFRIFLGDILEIRQLRQWGKVSLLNLLSRDSMIYFFVYAPVFFAGRTTIYGVCLYSALITYTATLTVWLTCPVSVYFFILPRP